MKVLSIAKNKNIQRYFNLFGKWDFLERRFFRVQSMADFVHTDMFVAIQWSCELMAYNLLFQEYFIESNHNY